MQNLLKYLSLVLLFAVEGAALAQRLHFEDYYFLKKNESLQTYTMFQDRVGIIWVGTSKGLFRFNGRTHQRFATADSIQDENITAIAEDSLGRLWIGCKSGKLMYLESGRFTPFDPPEGSAGAQISKILFDKKGRLWFSTLNDGLYYFVNSRLYRLDEDEGMPDIFVYTIVEDADGNIWAGTDRGLVRCTLDNNKIVIKIFNQAQGLPDNIVKHLSVEKDTLWISTEDAGIVSMQISSQQFSSPVKPWSSGSVSDFFVRDHQAYFISPQPGLSRMDVVNGMITSFELDNRIFSCMFRDREGNVWLGSKTGITRTPGDQIEFLEVGGSTGSNEVLAITSSSDNALWTSTTDGLTVTNSAGVKRSVLTNTPYSKYTVISLYEDEQGFVWAGLYGQGVLRINPKTGAIKIFSAELRNGNVLSITGNGNVVWLATLGGAAKAVVEGEKIQFTNYNVGSGLSSDFIYQVYIDSRNRVWFATDGRGVDMLDGTGFHHVEEGLPSKVVYGFAEDGKQDIWVNVQGNGIYKLSNNRFVADTALRLRDNNVNALSKDDFGNIVVMHDAGIDVIDSENSQVRSFDERSGLDNYIATLNCATRTRDGKILFGTNKGVVTYRTRRELLMQRPSVAIEGVKILDHNIVDWKKANDFSYDENNITFSFAGIWFQDVTGLSFQYKLENYDAEWIHTADNSVTFSKLPPGDYKFLVRASPNENFTTSVPASFTFHISPPFWRTNVFYGLVMVAAALTIYFIVKYRERQLLREKKILEMKVASRTQEIQRQKEEIQAQNEEIMAQAEEIKGINENLEMLVHQRTAELERKNRALEEYAFINAHKLRSPLASILGLTHLMAKTSLDSEAKEINSHLQQRAVELDEIVRSITKAIEKGADQH